MNLKSVPVIIRLSLSCLILFFVYQETGWATTLSIFLLMASNEIETLI